MIMTCRRQIFRSIEKARVIFTLSCGKYYLTIFWNGTIEFTIFRSKFHCKNIFLKLTPKWAKGAGNLAWNTYMKPGVHNINCGTPPPFWCSTCPTRTLLVFASTHIFNAHSIDIVVWLGDTWYRCRHLILNRAHAHKKTFRRSKFSLVCVYVCATRGSIFTKNVELIWTLCLRELKEF